jgi:hypothetical protein
VPGYIIWPQSGTDLEVGIARAGGEVFTRRFARLTVHLDCAAFEGRFEPVAAAAGGGLAQALKSDDSVTCSGSGSGSGAREDAVATLESARELSLKTDDHTGLQAASARPSASFASGMEVVFDWDRDHCPKFPAMLSEDCVPDIHPGCDGDNSHRRRCFLDGPHYTLYG